MGDERAAALARLAAVGGLGELVGAAQDVEVGAGVVGPVRLRHVLDGIGEAVTGAGTAEGRARPSRLRSIRRPRLRRGARSFVASALMGTSGSLDRRWAHASGPGA
ncbi:hypothetical protein GCM10020221_32700 [Streptomyces thioluteus]|uniref:Uncharacterized protein n=1 Tax=Streptomyces thioluteus TaxID=66431 RepID=A0ABP6JKA6_STRTU